jgi:putative peptidoglycan lipid II flippase
MERFFRVFHREWSGLHEAALLLAVFALLSQALGLVRDRVLAHHLGAGSELDVYYAAFRVPDLLYASIASFVAVTVLIPFLLDRLRDDAERMLARRFLDSVATMFILAMGGTALVSFIAMPVLAPFIVPGFSSNEQAQFVTLSRILLLSPVLLGLSNLLGAITQSFRRFFVFALGPVLYNVGIIMGIVFLLPGSGTVGLAWGVVLGALLHLGIQVPFVIRERLLPRPSFRVTFADVQDVVRTSIPRTIALGTTHLATIALVSFASRIETGAIAVFTFATNLQNIPLTIVGMSYSVAAFPTLARMWTDGQCENFFGQVLAALRHIIFWSFPAISVFVVLRAEIVRTILGSGQFDWTATRLTAAALALFSISVVAQGIVLLLTRAFYAMGKTREPLFANVLGASLVVGSVIVLGQLFESSQTFRYFIEIMLRVEDIPGTAVLMLPLGYSIGLIVNAILLFQLLARAHAPLWDGVRRAFLHSFTSAVALGFAAYQGLRWFRLSFDSDTFFGVLIPGVLSGMLGVIAWAFLLRLMKNRELEEAALSFRRKFWRSRPIAAEQESV